MPERFYNTPSRQGFHWPGRIVAGEGVAAAWLKDKTQRVAIVADRAFADHPLVQEAGGPAAIVGGEPRKADLAALLPGVIERRPECIVAIGGGATLDMAKALTALLRHGTTEIRDRPRLGATPHLVAMPTTAGSGSETSRFFILSDAAGVKIAMRSWSVVPELTLLDPSLTASLDRPGLVLGAFDAAIHLWETHIARGEASAFTDAIAQAHLPRILAALPALASGRSPGAATLQALMEASAMAGIAISNVRTGLIHTLGESLAAQCALPHPLTLRVFLRPAIESYAAAVADRTAALWRMADAMAPAGVPWSAARFVVAWEEAFAAAGLNQRLEDALAVTPVDLSRLCETAGRDTTLAKENPLPLDGSLLRLIAAAGLAPWGLAATARHAVNAS